MVAFGLILALVGVGGGALVAWLALQSSTGITLQGAGMAVTVLPITLFVAGVAAAVLLWGGWRMFVVGRRRRRAEREEIRQLRTTSAEAQRSQTSTEPYSPGTTASDETPVTRTPQPATGEVSGTRTGDRPVRGPMD